MVNVPPIIIVRLCHILKDALPLAQIKGGQLLPPRHDLFANNEPGGGREGGDPFTVR